MMKRLGMKNYNIMLIERQQKYPHYYEARIDKCEYLTGKETLPSDQKRLIFLILLYEKHLKNK